MYVVYLDVFTCIECNASDAMSSLIPPFRVNLTLMIRERKERNNIEKTQQISMTGTDGGREVG